MLTAVGFFLFISLKEQNKSNTLFHDANILASALDLLMAGTETTSTTLQWAVLLLMKYPEIQSRTPLWFCFSYIGYRSALSDFISDAHL